MERHYTCMIVDDEQKAIDYLTFLIGSHCPELRIVATAGDSASAVSKYFYHLPDLIFMDIEVDEKNGFEIYRDLYREKLKPYIIFVTGFDNFAIQAFKANALDYLLKPVDPDDLKAAVRKFAEAMGKDLNTGKINALLHPSNQKIKFNLKDGLIFIDPDQVIYCEADGNYTRIFTVHESNTLVSHNLGQVEKLLPPGHFWRCSRSYLVSMKFLSQVDRSKKICVLTAGTETIRLPLSPEQIRNIPD